MSKKKRETGGSGALKAGGSDEIRDCEGAGAGGQGNRRWLAVSYRKRERQDGGLVSKKKREMSAKTQDKENSGENCH